MNTTPRGAIETAGDTPNAPTGRQYFFGIGVDTYEHFPSLANAGKDVEDICAALCEHYYFERADTALLKGPAANRRNILRQLDAYRRNLTPDDRLLIYYAGHGLFDGGLGFWVPAEAERDEISTYIGNAEVREILRNIPARHILLISDSCFSASKPSSKPKPTILALTPPFMSTTPSAGLSAPRRFAIGWYTTPFVRSWNRFLKKCLSTIPMPTASAREPIRRLNGTNIMRGGTRMC